MELKRINKDGKLDHIQVNHTGTHPEQTFSTQMVDQGMAEGWISVVKGELVLHAKPEDLHYAILNGPGFYCCHDGSKHATGKDAQNYTAKKFAGKPSPDANNPAGYRKLNGYELRLNAAQHAKFKKEV